MASKEYHSDSMIRVHYSLVPFLSDFYFIFRRNINNNRFIKEGLIEPIYQTYCNEYNVSNLNRRNGNHTWRNLVTDLANIYQTVADSSSLRVNKIFDILYYDRSIYPIYSFFPHLKF